MPPRCKQIPEPTAMAIIYQFNKLKTPKFGGGADPMVYEEWKAYLILQNGLRGLRCIWPPINLKKKLNSSGEQ